MWRIVELWAAIQDARIVGDWWGHISAWWGVATGHVGPDSRPGAVRR